jgi:hypothetical protein
MVPTECSEVLQSQTNSFFSFKIFLGLAFLRLCFLSPLKHNLLLFLKIRVNLWVGTGTLSNRWAGTGTGTNTVFLKQYPYSQGTGLKEQAF